jgi:hypothetical protein
VGVTPDATITCIDCGGPAHLISTWPADDPPQPGDIMRYRCRDCLDCWYIELPDPDDR